MHVDVWCQWSISKRDLSRGMGYERAPTLYEMTAYMLTWLLEALPTHNLHRRPPESPRRYGLEQHFDSRKHRKPLSDALAPDGGNDAPQMSRGPVREASSRSGPEAHASPAQSNSCAAPFSKLMPPSRRPSLPSATCSSTFIPSAPAHLDPLPLPNLA